MISNSFYPIMLNISNFNCLIVGYGSVGKRKLNSLLVYKPKSVLIIDPFLSPSNISSDKHIKYENRKFEPGDLKNISLVFAATNNFEENDYICNHCNNMNILCNNVTNPELGTFILPSSIYSDELALTISTNGKCPYLSAKLKTELNNWLQSKRRIAWLLSKIRNLILEEKVGKPNQILDEILKAPVEEWLNNNNLLACENRLLEFFPVSSHIKINKLFEDYVATFSI